MNLDVCINKEDLLGEPEVGRRFKRYYMASGTYQFRKIKCGRIKRLCYNKSWQLWLPGTLFP